MLLRTTFIEYSKRLAGAAYIKAAEFKYLAFMLISFVLFSSCSILKYSDTNKIVDVFTIEYF